MPPDPSPYRGTRGLARQSVADLLELVPAKPTLPLTTAQYHAFEAVLQYQDFVTWESFRTIFTLIDLPRPREDGTTAAMAKILQKWVDEHTPALDTPPRLDTEMEEGTETEAPLYTTPEAHQPPQQAPKRVKSNTSRVPCPSPPTAHSLPTSDALLSLLTELTVDDEEDPGPQILLLLEEIEPLMTSPTPSPQAHLMFRTLQLALKSYIKQQQRMKTITKGVQHLLCSSIDSSAVLSGFPSLHQAQAQPVQSFKSPSQPRKPSVQTKAPMPRATRQWKDVVTQGPHVITSSVVSSRQSQLLDQRDDSKSISLAPTQPTQVTTDFGRTQIARAMLAHMKEAAPDTPSDLIQYIRRDARGTFYLQIRSQYWSVIASSLPGVEGQVIKLPDLGEWTLFPPKPPANLGKLCVVVNGVDSHYTCESFLAALWNENHESWGLPANRTTELGDARVLNRWTGEAWTASRSWAVWVSIPVYNKLKEKKTIHLDYDLKSVVPYTQQKVTCMSCGKSGHLAKFCRSKPVCRRCKGSHDTRCCPNDQGTKRSVQVQGDFADKNARRKGASGDGAPSI